MTATTFLSSKEHSCPACTPNREKLPLREQKSPGSTRLLERGFEGKKAQETFTRKSTSRTLKEVDQQYPPVFYTPGFKQSATRKKCNRTYSKNQCTVG
jgi:hypothetical protein